MLQSMGPQRVRHDWATEQQQGTELFCTLRNKKARFSYNEKNCFYTTLFKITIGVKIWGLREQATSFSSK